MLFLARTMAQIPTKCLEIESILVDACNTSAGCPGAVEADNEMVRFRVGPDAIALADLDVQWATTANSFLGFVQDATTAAITAQLNSTIQGCGWLLEPSGGVIPPGAPVVMVTSTNMCLEANSFAFLNDTVHIIFQAAGNSIGHFANNQLVGQDITTEPGAPQLRTLIIEHVPTACADTAVYDRSLLVNIYGTYGGANTENDGATVLYTWPGIPQVTYVNNGCVAPVEVFQVEIAPPTGDLCSGASIELSGTASADAVSIYWQGGTGTFSDPGSASTTYTAGVGDVGDVELEFCAESPCGEVICASVTIPAGTAPVVEITTDGAPAICEGGSIELNAVGNGEHAWSTGEAGDTIVVTEEGAYTVTSTNACGTATASITIVLQEPPVAAIEGDTLICPGTALELTAIGGDTYLWDNGSTDQSIQVDTPGTYSVLVSNACGSDAAMITVAMGEDIVAAFDVDVSTGMAPLGMLFLNLSVPDDADFAWDMGDGFTTIEPSPYHVFTDPGEYTVTLVAQANGCSDTASMVIVVDGPDPVPVDTTESWVSVPDVFTPNSDGFNDVLTLQGEGLITVDMKLYNRWGQLVYQILYPLQSWDGRSFAGEPLSEGTYFYELRATGKDGKLHERRGSVTLLR